MAGYSLKKQAVFLLFGRGIAFVMLAVSPMILVRMLTVSEFGIYRQVIFVETVVLGLITMRIPQNLYYFFPRKNGRHQELLSQTLSMLSVTSAVGAILFYLFARFFDVVPTGVTGEYLLPLALWMFVSGVSSLLEHIFILEKRSTAIPVLSAGSQIVRLGLIIAAILFFKSVLIIVYALILYSILSVAFLIAYLMKRYPIQFGIADKMLFREQLAYGIPLAAATIVGLIGNQFEKAVIAALTAPEDFAIYSIGGLGAMYAISVVYTSMGDVAVPRFGELAVEKDFAGIKTLWHRIVSINSLLTVPVVVFGFIFAREIITLLFTSKYVASATIWRINLFTLIMQMLAYGYIATAMGKTKAIFLGNAIRAAFVIPIAFYMVTKMGILGGGIAFVTGFWLNGLIQIFASQKAINLSFRELLPWKKLSVIVAVSIIPAFLVSYANLLGLQNFPTLLIAGSVYFFIVALAFWQIGYLNVQDIRRLLVKTA